MTTLAHLVALMLADDSPDQQMDCVLRYKHALPPPPPGVPLLPLLLAVGAIYALSDWRERHATWSWVRADFLSWLALTGQLPADPDRDQALLPDSTVVEWSDDQGQPTRKARRAARRPASPRRRVSARVRSAKTATPTPPPPLSDLDEYPLLGSLPVLVVRSTAAPTRSSPVDRSARSSSPLSTADATAMGRRQPRALPPPPDLWLEEATDADCRRVGGGDSLVRATVTV
jgi:hypothetical protein